jgi:hypothetical protein
MLYSDKHKIKFTNISENYQVKKSFKGTLSSMHSSVITYVVKHYQGTAKYKEKVVKILNTITYAVYAAEPLPLDWSPQNPFINMPNIDDDAIREVLGDIYLTVDAIEWDLAVVEEPNEVVTKPADTKPAQNIIAVAKPKFTPVDSAKVEESVKDFSVKPTDPLDLYLQAPEVPQFDINKPFITGVDGADKLVIYTTLPEIPKRQRDISVTTDINKMTDADLMNLFPNHFIRTRAEAMYEDIGLESDELFGNIIPIDGYTKEQVLKCIIEYPHLYKLARHQKGLQSGTDYPSFYGWMEIKGELVFTMDIWDSLPISKMIPRQAEYVKEYVVRKYLLDRDNGVYFKYPLFGDLQPFLTLVMPAEEYRKRGYDPLEIAKQCVRSRVAFKQSRNPVLRRLNKNV